MGLHARREHGFGIVAEGPYCNRLSRTRRHRLYGGYTTTVFAGCVETIAHLSGCDRYARDRCTVARAGDITQSTVLCVLVAQWPRGVPRVLLVLFLQRAPAAFLESSLSAGLQHRAARAVLGAELGVGVSVVSLSSRGSGLVLQTRNTGRTGATDGVVLDRRHYGVFYAFHDAGVLLHADLPGAGTADRLGS